MYFFGACLISSHNPDPSPDPSLNTERFLVSFIILYFMQLSWCSRGRWFRNAERLLFDRKCFWSLASLIIIADAALCALIIARVKCGSMPAASGQI